MAFEPVRRFEPVTTAQGLSHNAVTTIFQDSRGFIWLGTRDGLNRFDGYQFKVFKQDAQIQGAIADNFIASIFEDSQGVLWIGTGEGLNRYDPAKEQFSRYLLEAGLNEHDTTPIVRDIIEDSQNRLWIATEGAGLFVIAPDRQATNQYTPSLIESNALSHHNITTLLQDRQGDIWIGSENGLNRLKADSSEFEHFYHQTQDSNSLSGNWIKALFEDEQGRLWVGTDGDGLSRFDAERQNITRISVGSGQLSSGLITSFTAGPGNKLWVTTWGGGLNLIDIDTGAIEVVRFNKQAAFGIQDDLLFQVYRDKQGLMWLGSSLGASRYNPATRIFGHFRKQHLQGERAPDNRIRAILKDSHGGMWLGTRGDGLIYLDENAAKVNHFRHDPNRRGSLLPGQIYSLHETADGSIWVGTTGGLNRFKPQSLSFEHDNHHPDIDGSLSENRIKALSQGSDNQLWIGTWGGGLNVLDITTGLFRHFKHDAKDPNSISHDIIMTLFHDSKGRLWIGTLGGGLNLYEPRQQRFVRFIHDIADSRSLSNNRVFAVSEDDNGTIWVGTAAGLNRYDEASGQFMRLGKAQGLVNETILALLHDKKGVFWLSTNQGLSRFDSKTNELTHFSAIDGLQDNEFSVGSAAKANDGELLFGGVNGFNRFYPDNIKPRNSKLNIVLTDMLLANQSVPIVSDSQQNAGHSFTLTAAINELEQLQLTHNEHQVTFEFAALDFTNPSVIKYAYQLEGVNNDWVYTDVDRRYATYTRLKPGQYRFKVKAANADGLWSDEKKALNVTVLPPWWASKLAYIIYLLLLAGAIWLVYRVRTQSLVKRAQALEHEVMERTQTINRLLAQKDRMFANVSHEFKTPLTLILNPLERLTQGIDSTAFNNQVSMMQRNGQRLLTMVDQLLELSKLDTTQTQIKYNYSLAQTLQLLLSSFEPLFQSKKLNIHYQPVEDVVLSMSADALEMILNNLLSNAVKYTPEGGDITVAVTTDDTWVEINVCDTGIGISEENQKLVFNRFTRAYDNHQENIPGAGVGLALVKELVEANDGDISLQSEAGKGTEFSVKLPICQQVEGELANSLELTNTSKMSIVSMQSPEAEVKSKTQSDVDQATVLLIDDNADMLELLNQTLAQSYQCISAANGTEGLELAQQSMPDLIISDVMMPGINGFEVLKQLKSTELTNHIPVMLLTAKGDSQSRIRGWTENADEYLEKPFNSEELHARIENLMFVRSLLRHKYQSVFNATKINNNAHNHSSASVLELPQSEGEQTLNEVNMAFFRKVEAVLEKHYSDETFDVNLFADELFMSYRQLSRKMKSLLNLTPKESIRCYRLKKAAEQLKQGHSPSGVAFNVGFTSHSYFSQCFKAQYNCLPSAYK